MQATTAPALATPQAPATPITAAASVAPAVAGAPRTVADLLGLRAQRKELSNQLENVAARRARLSSSLAGKEGLNRAGIEARINVLDKRMMQLESDLAETGHQLTAAPGALVAAAEARQFNGMSSDSIAALGGVFMIFLSEGQRFVTRILSEAHSAPALPASQRHGEAVESAQQPRT